MTCIFITITGKLTPLGADSSNFNHHQLESEDSNQIESRSNESPPALPDNLLIQNRGTANVNNCFISTPEYEDTADLLSPPPLPPRSS